MSIDVTPAGQIQLAELVNDITLPGIVYFKITIPEPPAPLPPFWLP
jgi:hypothetical protein